MKRVILDSIVEFNLIKRDVFTPGAVIRVLTNDDVARVGNIVVLKRVGAPNEDDLILEVTHPTTAAAPDTDDADNNTADTPSDDDKEEEGKDCYW